MTGPMQPIATEYGRQLLEYQLKVAAWLGIDPAEVTEMKETKQTPTNDGLGLPMPPDLLVSWKSYGRRHDCEEHLGRHRMPYSMFVVADEDPVFTNSVLLDWSEVERLRAEVGEPPDFPAPAGGWPAVWNTRGS